MKPHLRRIAIRYWSSIDKAYHTRSTTMKNRMPLKKMRTQSLQKQRRRKPSTLAGRNIVGFKISHGWKEGNGTITQWEAVILDQLPTNPTLYLVKYDGSDCVYGVELCSDKRILNLKVFPQNVVFDQQKDTHLAIDIVGSAVEHQFEDKHGSKESWSGVVLAQVPIMKDWFYITYEKDPVLYMYKLLDDYAEGNLRIIPQIPQAEVKSYSDNSNFTGKFLQYTRGDGSKKIGKVIYKVLANPSTYLIKLDGDSLIYVYNLEEKIH